MRSGVNRWVGAFLAALLALVLVLAIGWYWVHDLVWVVARHWIALTDVAGSQAPTALSDLGQAGELMGGATAMFAGLAVIGIAVAVWLQLDMLRVQRERLDEERRRPPDTPRANVVTTHVVGTPESARESTLPLFFRLIDLLRSQVRTAQLDVAVDAPLEKARLDFRTALARQNEIFSRTWSAAAASDTADQKIDRLVDRYEGFYRANESQLGPYFRTLYQALKLIDRSALDDAEKAAFANILRGVLGSDELQLIALDALTPDGAGLKPLVEKYGLLKHLPRAANGAKGFATTTAELRFSPTARMSSAERHAYSKEQVAPTLLVD